MLKSVQNMQFFSGICSFSSKAGTFCCYFEPGFLQDLQDEQD